MNYLFERSSKGKDPTAKQFKLDFKLGKDQDYVGSNLLITFDVDEHDNYTLKGHTGGIVTHACKHLKEFEPSYFEAIFKVLRQHIIKYIKEHQQDSSLIVQVFSRESAVTKQKTNLQDQIELINKVPSSALANFLDLISDKCIIGEKLTDFEKSCKKFLSIIAKKYADKIIEYKNASKEIKNEDSKETVNRIIETSGNFNFEVSIKGEAPFRLYVIHNTILMIVRKGIIATMFDMETTSALVVKIIRDFKISNEFVRRKLLRLAADS